MLLLRHGYLRHPLLFEVHLELYYLLNPHAGHQLLQIGLALPQGLASFGVFFIEVIVLGLY